MSKYIWENISKFDLNDPVSEYGFSTRLASENFWTKHFTITAIQEYKKFMYLAATSEFMVSPSAIVDIVWHQHLIFTESYSNFCNLIGKQIQHSPSTHNKAEFKKFAQAKERTTKLYNQAFGEQPKEIWEYAGMFESLELPKAKIKIRTFIIIGILSFAILILPFYYLLRPVYTHIDNPYFLEGFIAIVMFTFFSLEFYNRNYLSKTLRRFKPFTLIHHLQPPELVYLQTQQLSEVVHGTINLLINDKLITVNGGYSVEHTSTLKINSLEEHQALDCLHNLGAPGVSNVTRALTNKTDI